jgi:hypothetical protein
VRKGAAAGAAAPFFPVYKIPYTFFEKPVDKNPMFLYTYPCYERKALA